VPEQDEERGAERLDSLVGDLLAGRRLKATHSDAAERDAIRMAARLAGSRDGYPRMSSSFRRRMGRLLEKVSKGPFADSTIVFVVEDDAQDGPDHVDARRSLLANNFGNGLGEAVLVGLLVKRLACLLRAQELLQRLRPDQAADVGGENPIGASLHYSSRCALFRFGSRAYITSPITTSPSAGGRW